jgi:hypothetical protein
MFLLLLAAVAAGVYKAPIPLAAAAAAALFSMGFYL